MHDESVYHNHDHGFNYACSHEHDHDHGAGADHTHDHPHVHSHTHTKAVLNRLSRAIGHLESVKRNECRRAKSTPAFVL